MARLTARRLADKVAERMKESLFAQPAAVAHNFVKWVLDGGSCFDIANEDSLTSINNAQRQKRENPYILETANGTMEAGDEAQFEIDKIGRTTTALVLPNSPSVLSLGRMCVHGGYFFVWNSGETIFHNTRWKRGPPGR